MTRKIEKNTMFYPKWIINFYFAYFNWNAQSSFSVIRVKFKLSGQFDDFPLVTSNSLSLLGFVVHRVPKHSARRGKQPITSTFSRLYLDPSFQRRSFWREEAQENLRNSLHKNYLAVIRLKMASKAVFFTAVFGKCYLIFDYHCQTAFPLWLSHILLLFPRWILPWQQAYWRVPLVWS